MSRKSETPNLTPDLALPRDGEGPVFSSPWEAQAFAIVVRLFEQAHYTWPEWAEYLSAEIGRASTEPDVADASQYYEHWLAAAEKLVVAKGITTPAELAERKRTLADAARPAHEHEH